MKTILKIILSLFIFFITITPTASAAKIRVACIGNSITQNSALLADEKYPAVLQQLLGTSGYEVRNYGISARTMLRKGDYPYWNEAKYMEALGWKPDIVVIKLGTNDAKPENWVHKSEYQTDYVDFVNSFKAANPSAKIFVCYPLPGFVKNWIGISDTTFVKEMIPMINNVSVITGATVIDLHTPFMGKDFMTYDNVHPNYAGTAYMAHIIAPYVCPTCVISEFPEESKYLIASDDLTKHAKAVTSSIAANMKDIYDNNLSTGLDVPFVDNSWIAFELSDKYNLTGYSIISGRKEAKDAPSSWIIEGSTTGVLWSRVEEKRNISFDTDQSQFFSTITNANNIPHSYKYYRIKFKGNNGGRNLQLDEIQLFGFQSTVPPSLINNGGELSGQYEGYPGELVENLNDLNIKKKYCVVDKNGGWIQYTSSQQAKVGAYSITSSFGFKNRNPRSWTFEASNDGVNWDLLDIQKNQEFVAYFHTMYYPVKCEKEYMMFRLNIEQIFTETTFEFSEWQLFESSISGLNENKIEGISIIVKDQSITIVSNNEKIQHYDVLDLSGRVLLSQDVDENKIVTPQILTSGIFLVRVKTDENTFAKKCFVSL